ncbi:MAG: AAA family ATPase [Desulfuromonadales bacterium]
MILRSIEMENFGRFQGQTIEFRRGMNLVIGPNEAGKSTIAEAVPAVLFGTDRLEQYKPWGRNACSASLFFEGGGRTIQIKRNLITDQVELVERDDLYQPLSQFSGKAPLRGRSSSCREYRQLLESLLGVTDEKLFRATYYFGHQPQDWSGDELAQNLRTLVSGTAEADYANILDRLLDEHFALTRSNPWGRDKQRDREYEDVCCKLEKLGPVDVVPVFVEIDDSTDIAAQLEALSAELADDRIEYEKGLRYVDHVRSSQVATAASDSQTPVDETSQAAGAAGQHDLREQLAAAGLPENPPVNLQELLAEAAEIRQEMSALQQPYAALGSREKKIPGVPWTVLLSVVGLLTLVTAAAWWRQLYPLPVASIAVIVVACFAGFCGWRFWRRRTAQAECSTERGKLDQKKSAVQDRQSELSERCEALGLPSSPIDLVRLQKLVSKNLELLESYWGLPAAERPGDGVVEQLPQSREDNGKAGPGDDSPPAGEAQELEARLAEFAAEMDRKEARLQKLKAQLEQRASAQQVNAGGDGAALLQRKHELETRIRLLRKAINLLVAAVDEFGRSHLVHLNQEASRLFAKITAGRYAEIRLDENMVPSIRVQGRRWMPAENFSKGTVDALYLALRTALTKLRDDGRSLPLMLDDPFVHLDQKRLAIALNMVDLASVDGQLVLFSHNLELGKRAARERWHVVPLDENTAETRTDEEGGEHAGQLHLL